MATAWTCPGCRTPIRYEDYDHFMQSSTRFCPDCGLKLAIDKGTDQLLPAVPTAYTSPKRKPSASH
jgi:hypothetical protein